MRYKLIIEYDGTRYSGWQVQNDARTIQGEIIKAVRDVFPTQTIDLQGSGRTDSGVHALGQVAHLDAVDHDPTRLRFNINDRLPPDIHIVHLEKTNPKFHARHDATGRSYLYQISRRRTAFGKKMVWWIKDKLHFGNMERAARIFEGMHDFESFTRKDGEHESARVQIEEFRVEEHGELILLRVVGSHFLWKMARQMVGVLVEVGRGNMTSENVEQLLKKFSTAPAQLTAPPSGLYLEKVYYPGDERLKFIEPVLRLT